MGVKNKYFSVRDLIETQGSDEAEIKTERDRIVKKFRETLENLGFDESMISWYRSGGEVASGSYIFAGASKNAVANNLSDLFELWGEAEKEPLYGYMINIIAILQELLPFTKREDMINNLPDEQTEEISKMFSMIDKIKGLKIFKQYHGKASKKEELHKIYKNLEKISKLKSILLEDVQKSSVSEEFEDYGARKRKIEDAVCDLFLKRMNNQYFSDKKFYGKDIGETLYQKVKKWHIKWLCLFDNIEELRQAEEVYNICELSNIYEDEIDVEKYFRGEKPLSYPMKELYGRICKLTIRSFSKYYEGYYDDEKQQKMIRDNYIKRLLKERNNVRKAENVLWCCNQLVEDVGQWKCRGINQEDTESMKLEALRELSMISKAALDIGNDSEDEDIVQSVPEEVQVARKEFLDYYDELHINKKIIRECLECVFDIKYENRGMITDCIPHTKAVEEFRKKPIVDESESERK